MGRPVGTGRSPLVLASGEAFSAALARDVDRRLAAVQPPDPRRERGPAPVGGRAEERTQADPADRPTRPDSPRRLRTGGPQGRVQAPLVRRDAEETGPGFAPITAQEAPAADPGGRSPGVTADPPLGELAAQASPPPLSPAVPASPAPLPALPGGLPSAPTGGLAGVSGAPGQGIAPGGGHGSAAQGARRAAPAAHRPAPTAADLERAQQVLQQIRLRLSPSLLQATIELEPEHLGRIAIRLRVDGGSLTAVLRAESPQTLAVLEQHIPELRAMLSQQGLDAGDFDLGLAWQEPGDGPFGGGERETWPGVPAPSGIEAEAAAGLPNDPIELARVLAAGGGVDTWA